MSRTFFFLFFYYFFFLIVELFGFSGKLPSPVDEQTLGTGRQSAWCKDVFVCTCHLFFLNFSSHLWLFVWTTARSLSNLWSLYFLEFFTSNHGENFLYSSAQVWEKSTMQSANPKRHTHCLVQEMDSVVTKHDEVLANFTSIVYQMLRPHQCLQPLIACLRFIPFSALFDLTSAVLTGSV